MSNWVEEMFMVSGLIAFAGFCVRPATSRRPARRRFSPVALVSLRGRVNTAGLAPRSLWKTKIGAFRAASLIPLHVGGRCMRNSFALAPGAHPRNLRAAIVEAVEHVR
jgi:hypothetical protein